VPNTKEVTWMRSSLTPHDAESFFHVVNHSIDGRNLFYDEGDYRTYLTMFKAAIGADLTVIAYCLMPNHFHFLLRQNVANAMSTLFEVSHKRYARYFNKKHGFKGTIFRSRLNHKEVTNEKYLLQACAYIHANPVQANLVNFPEEWAFSNFREYMQLRDGSLWSEQFLKDYIGNQENYRDRVIEIARNKTLQRAFEKDLLPMK